MRSTAMARNDMIERQVIGSAAAILARECIAQEDFLPGELDASARSPNEADEPDDGRVGVRLMRRRNQRIVRFEDLGFASENQHDGAASVANVERLVVLIENQDRFVHTCNCSR
jgi:hypothetical protein